MSEKTRYPLCWPEGWKRAKYRIRASFGSQPRGGPKTLLSVREAIDRVGYELGRMHVQESNIVVSTNLPLNIHGQPRADRGEPGDRGAAVYWHKAARKGETIVTENKAIAIDRYDRVADNIAAIAATLEYMRGIERHGGAEILDRVFVGFAQLPERAGGRGWRDILGFPPQAQPTKDAIGSRFRELSKDRHPEKPGGSRELFEELLWARDAGLRELAPPAPEGGQ
jgi:hypothetical protein